MSVDQKDYEKRKQKLLTKSLKILNGKRGLKIRTFIELSKALKITTKTLRFYSITNIPEIKELLEKHRHEKNSKNNRKIAAKNRVKIRPKNEENIPAQKEEKLVQKIEPKPIHDNRLRTYEEIKAKLFGYKAWKQKNYEKISPAAKTVIDRQIAILEWVMNKNFTRNKEGENAD